MIGDTLQRAVTGGTVRRDVAMDITQQVDNLINSQETLSATERHRHLDVIREGVRTRERARDLPEGVATDLDTSLLALRDAMDRQVAAGSS